MRIDRNRVEFKGGNIADHSVYTGSIDRNRVEFKVSNAPAVSDNTIRVQIETEWNLKVR